MNLLSIRLSYVVRLLGAAAILIVLVSIGGQLSLFLLGHGNLKGLVPLFYVGNEGNIPTGFSVLLMLVTCILLAVIALLKRKQGDSHASYWAVLFCGFLFMAYDEAFQVHEKLIAPVRGLLGDFGYGVFFYAWVLPGAALVIILWMFFRKFLSQLTTPARSRFLVAAFIYLGGAIGVESVGGRYIDFYGQQNLISSMITTVEESLEMAGLIIFIWALLKYCGDTYGEVRLQFEA